MRTLLGALVTVVVGATAFTGYVMTTGRDVDTTVSVDTTARQPASYTADCRASGLVYGLVTVSGVRTTSYDGCVNPAALGNGDSFTGHLAQYIRDNSHR